MNVFGIDHVFETYEGDHTSGIAERLENNVFPFFSDNLRGAGDASSISSSVERR
jgi:hypothetical protein